MSTFITNQALSVRFSRIEKIVHAMRAITNVSVWPPCLENVTGHAPGALRLNVNASIKRKSFKEMANINENDRSISIPQNY